MTRSVQNKFLIILICMVTSACSGIKYLAPGEKLYTGPVIKLESPDKIKKNTTRLIEAMAKDAARPKPNKAYLGMRPKLWLNRIAGDNPKSKFRKWLKKAGQEPVLLSDVKPGVTSAIIDARIFNIGIFKSFTEFNIIEKKHTAKVIYTSHIHQPYTIQELVYSIPDDSLSYRVLMLKDKSLIRPGKDYNLALLKNERIRIDASLKDSGYFYFSPDYLLFKADTSDHNRTVSLKLTLKDSIPENALTVYRINNVFIDQDYSLNTDSTEIKKDTIKYQNTVFLGKASDMNIRPNVISRSVYLKKNEIYSRKNHTITLSRLMSMGNFKFIQIKFTDSDTTASGFLDVTILMTPMPKHTFNAEMEIVSKSNSFAGPRVNLSILDRNTFRGAELLNLSMAGSFEAQFSGNTKNSYSYSWNPQVELVFPFYVLPFKINSKSNVYVPKTRLLVSYNYLKRVNYFDMKTFQFIYGYRWKKNVKTEFEVNPIQVSYTAIGNKSALFTKLLDSIPYLRRSYEEQFIAGGSFSYTYNEQMIPGKRIQYFFHGAAEIGGNAFSLARVIGGNEISSEDPGRIAGSIYSQYARLSIDARGYYNFSSKEKLAVRFFAGVARPYGNSSTLPYSKQFFSGGPNSIRAFGINSLGPGSYHQKADLTGFLQLGGDVKLEMNVEYRFTIYRFLKAALFADAGNIWLLKSNPSDTGSSFSYSGFSNDLAVGAGVGLRFDVSFFILRFDLATPLRKPWLEKSQRWVANQMRFGDSAWRNENLILNVAIGYPF